MYSNNKPCDFNKKVFMTVKDIDETFYATILPVISSQVYEYYKVICRTHTPCFLFLIVLK